MPTGRRPRAPRRASTQGVDQLELQLDRWSNPSEPARAVHAERSRSAMLGRDAVMAKLALPTRGSGWRQGSDPRRRGRISAASYVAGADSRGGVRGARHELQRKLICESRRAPRHGLRPPLPPPGRKCVWRERERVRLPGWRTPSLRRAQVKLQTDFGTPLFDDRDPRRRPPEDQWWVDSGADPEHAAARAFRGEIGSSKCRLACIVAAALAITTPRRKTVERPNVWRRPRPGQGRGPTHHAPLDRQRRPALLRSREHHAHRSHVHSLWAAR